MGDHMKCAPTKNSIERILVGIDGSDSSLRAARLAGEMALTFAAEITLLHALSPSDPPHRTGDTSDDLDDEARGQDVLSAAIAIMNDLRVMYDTKVVVGHPVEEILMLAEEKGDEKGFDLIVLGGKGTSEANDLMTDGVCQKVSRRSKLPVLVVP